MTPYEEKEGKKKVEYDFDIDGDIDIGMDTYDGTPSHFKDKELARAYIPFQRAGTMYHPEDALKKGTVYPELYRPYKHSGRGH